MSNAQPKYILTDGMSKEEWLLQRKNGIGASEIGAVLGFNKYRTPYQVWLDKTSRDIIEAIETPAMRRGTRMEEIVAEEYSLYTGNKIRNDNKIRIHPNLPFLFASLDRIIIDREDGKGVGVLECKTVSSQAKKSWEEEIPLYYYAQIQQQLAVTGYSWGEIALLVADTFELTVLPFQRDDSFIQQLESLATIFWTENVQKKVSPPMELPDLETQFIREELKAEANQDLFITVNRIIELDALAKETKEKADELRNTVKEFMGVRTHLTYGDQILATWKTIDKKGYEVKPTSYRSFIVKK